MWLGKVKVREPPCSVRLVFMHVASFRRLGQGPLAPVLFERFRQVSHLSPAGCRPSRPHFRVCIAVGMCLSSETILQSRPMPFQLPDLSTQARAARPPENESPRSTKKAVVAPLGHRGIENIFRTLRRLASKGTENGLVSLERIFQQAVHASRNSFKGVAQDTIAAQLLTCELAF